MHDTAHLHGRLFFELYWQPEFRIVAELGSYDVNGRLRDHAPPGVRWVGFDMAPGPGVDVAVAPGAALPLADGSVDVAVTSSAFEHDAAFWQTFLELVRILRPGGLLYLNAPSNHVVHRFPLDCWRFYPDAGLALCGWAARQGTAVMLAESFVGRQGGEGWCDFVAVFRKAGPGALQRRGRIADHAPAVNILDGGEGGPPRREAERAETDEMLAIAALRAAVVEAGAGEPGSAAGQAIAALQARLAEHESAEAISQARLATRERELEAAGERLAEREARLEAAGQALAARDAALAEALKRLTGCEQDLAMRDAALTDARARLAGREQDLADLSARLAGREAEVTALLARQAAQDAALAEARRDAAAQAAARAAEEAHVQRILASRSWRITAPLRAVLTRLGRRA
ncbi:methyltransferase domain-containing protein [Paracraurococcus lichenis]|uniref:Methyltransferase domain-containing protein n=1 Tax=Paracraurococcus lichenis TaxID=3064888 RepID=A0ABT9DWR5_9PROT|nr:methyltransferase domain-containing protein [Paracraurococcus sp. LOR1-02]MDO9708318.1 methyltransferase domain-containing protein [Paracraurococcus sp. LOR1-02]